MDFSLNFIKQFVDIKNSAQDLAERLTSAGLEVENVEKVSDDWVFSAEVTTNRYDWLSIVGIAQEVAAVLGKKIKLDYPRIKTTPKPTKKKILIDNLDDCSYYLGREIKKVKVKQSPAWLKKILINSKLTSVNNIVDVTNYCMLKWGNPLHAFDLDKIKGDIHIRRAKDKEEFIGIDQKQRTLTSENLVIADSKKVIALAGIMGAKNSEVTANSKNIFLEAAKFSPITIRCSRRAIGLDTESSYRFERRVSESFLEYASGEATDKILKLAEAEFTGYRKVGKKTESKPKQITIKLSKMKNYLGADFKTGEVKKILTSLNFKVKKDLPDTIKVKPALSRFDIEKEVDVYEEFARIYGYNKIEPKIPFIEKALKTNPVLEKEENSWKFKNKIRDFAALLGFAEIITYSMENKDELSLFTEEEGLGLRNPLRSQENSLRPTLFLGMIKSIKHNLNRGKENLAFFEIADKYKKKGGNKVDENTFLSLGVSGDRQRFFLLKGAVLEILDYLNINYLINQTKLMSANNALEIKVKDRTIGFIGKLDEKLKEKFGLKEDLFLSELNLNLLGKFKQDKKFESFSKFPVIWRDISLAIDKNTKFKKIQKIIEEGSRHLLNLKIIDTYQDKNLSKDHFGFTLRLFYQSREKTLNSNQVDSYHNQIREKLYNKEGIILR
ncbi:MAG: phenylalanine--tRNA ligase subunit beta [Candidatus Omnitrophica bacterium]|nr:phenylalanine--tRNA ligase subunit beta [Candidatus Omnitrophota bacterium]MCF7895086.1 phenylalanine--tRNA ligase subunit beta [Candidatus Omnitrophota bacterium]